jgi:hypothetical protein
MKTLFVFAVFFLLSSSIYGQVSNDLINLGRWITLDEFLTKHDDVVKKSESNGVITYEWVYPPDEDIVITYKFHNDRLFYVGEWLDIQRMDDIRQSFSSLARVYGNFDGPDRWRVPATRSDYYNDYICNYSTTLKIKFTILEIAHEYYPVLFIVYSNPEIEKMLGDN